MMRIKNRIIVGLLAIILLIASAYLLEYIMKEYGVKSATIIKITENNKVIAYISADVLKQLVEENNKQKDDSIPNEPSLLLALNAAGINSFNEIEIKGKNNSNSVVLHKVEVDDNLKLILESNGTVDLCEKNDNINSLMKAVVEINIKK